MGILRKGLWNAKGEPTLHTRGYVWHLMHRSHKKEFLLKFARDGRRYVKCAFEAKKRYSLSVLRYTVTSNHVHLLVRDKGPRDVTPKSIHMMACDALVRPTTTSTNDDKFAKSVEKSLERIEKNLLQDNVAFQFVRQGRTVAL